MVHGPDPATEREAGRDRPGDVLLGSRHRLRVTSMAITTATWSRTTQPRDSSRMSWIWWLVSHSSSLQTKERDGRYGRRISLLRWSYSAAASVTANQLFSSFQVYAVRKPDARSMAAIDSGVNL